MYALLTALPWVGRELFEKKENDLERIMAAMEGYLRRRNTAQVAALRVWNCDTPHPQVHLANLINLMPLFDIEMFYVGRIFGLPLGSSAQVTNRRVARTSHLQTVSCF